jgi:Holliday junction resolvase RusA-like endonuclease
VSWPTLQGHRVASPGQAAPARDEVRLSLPWRSCAVPDNAAYRAVPLGPKSARIRLSERGRDAKAAIHDAAFAVTRGGLMSGPLALDAVAYPPDARSRDAGNLRKLLTDALQGAVYDNDRQLVDERWRMGAIDRERPRVEVLVTRARGLP